MDKWSLEIVSAGYSDYFILLRPSHLCFLSLFRDPLFMHLLEQKIDSLLDLGTIEQFLYNTEGKGFIPGTFRFQKRNVRWKPFLHLRLLNRFVKIQIQSDNDCDNTSIGLRQLVFGSQPTIGIFPYTNSPFPQKFPVFHSGTKSFSTQSASIQSLFCCQHVFKGSVSRSGLPS